MPVHWIEDDRATAVAAATGNAMAAGRRAADARIAAAGAPKDEGARRDADRATAAAAEWWRKVRELRGREAPCPS